VTFPGVTPAARFDPAHLDWPETNCYLDLWIELLLAWGLDPAPALGFAASTGFEGDQFTFGRPSHDDLARLHGVSVHELTVYRPLLDHIAAQQAQGATVLVEVDAYHLPDTRGTTYGAQHAKTTMAVLHHDPAAGRIDYIHNRGRGSLAGADLPGALGGEGVLPLPPYVELARRSGPALHGCALAGAARDALAARLRQRPAGNPIAAFRASLVRDGARLAAGGTVGFHPYAFATYRMLGVTFQTLGQMAGWLRDGGDAGLDGVIEACRAGSSAAKAEQFRAARAIARGRAPDPGEPLDRAEAAWDAALQGLDARYA